MQWLVDLIFPKKCVGCGKVGGYICEACEVGLWEEEQICPICARGSRYGLRHRYCYEPYSLDGLTCLWAYEGVARKIIQKAKYKFCFDLLAELGRQSFGDTAASARRPPPYRQFPTARSVGNRLHAWLTYFWKFIEEKPVVVSVPLYKKRERWRGFNQAEVMGKLIADLWGLEYKNLLKRVRDTGQQVGRSREERLKNVQGAFEINSKLPKYILLVDDVWTSGATMRECARVLKKAGVKRVWGLVLAR